MPGRKKPCVSRGAAVTLTSKAHRAVSEYEDDNIGVQAVQETTKAVESTVYTVDHAVYSHKLKAYDKAEKLVEKSDKANVNALYEKFKKDNPDAGSNPFSRWQQKRAIKKEYAAAKAGKNTASTTASASKGAGKARGNRPDIFGNDIYATPGGEYTDYDIPGEALTDTRFANMIREAEKYLGYPYVWGGSSPSTSFDCSGFVSYVINHCGNGWSVGRLTANGLMGVCDIIPKSSAKPGDLIFFQGTYDTSGASHVGIYVGNGMMIHCGNPISYASIESNYWQQHFYCFGRIRN